MRPSKIVCLCFLSVVVFVSACDSANPKPFIFDAGKIEVGTVYFYKKSNIDGSNAGNIALYVASPTQLESLKWHDGDSTAALVVAEMDWQTFSVRRFDAGRLHAGGERTQMAVLQAIDGTRAVEIILRGMQPDTVEVDFFPWHSYDFDFASLNFTLRHLKAAEEPFTIGIADLLRTAEGMQFGNKGPVEVRYIDDEMRQNMLCRVYHIDGPGLENRGGKIWVNKAKPFIVDYEIDLPDEQSYESGKLTIQQTVLFSSAAWQRLLREFPTYQIPQ